MKIAPSPTYQCSHDAPAEGWGASQVHWDDRVNSIGWAVLACDECGELLRWDVSA